LDSRLPHRRLDIFSAGVPIVNVTFFADYAAKTLSTADMTLQELWTLVLKTTASEKAQLPWLKLATFGDKLSSKNSLRHDANVEAITGIELDYDRERMSFDDAVDLIEKARLNALIYSSPSHTVKKPRWRILLPTSCTLAPAKRKKLVARVNGLFGGIFAGESFTLSQAYYYGAVNSNQDHRAKIVEGDFIDLRSNLDASALDKGQQPKLNGHATGAPLHILNGNAQGRGTSTDAHDVRRDGEADETLIDNIRSGEIYNPSLLALSARWIVRGETREKTIKFLQGLMNESVGERDQRWKDRVASIPGLVDSALEKKAREWAPNLEASIAAGHGADKQTEAVGQSQGLSLQWHGDALPAPQRWLIRNRLPETGAGLLVGQWGMLKTFLALDLSAHVMMGWNWTGEPVYRKAGVLCLAQEGSGSIPMRLAALVEQKVEPHEGKVKLPFAWASQCPMLLGKDKDDPLPVLLATAKEAHDRFMKDFSLPLGLIWIDTLSSAGGWSDENNNAEAAQLMNVVRTLSDRSGAVVIGVDHLGKNVEAGSRGASAKEANSDFVLALLGTKNLAGDIADMRLALRKMREGPSGLEIPVAPVLVDMGKDEHGYPLTSVVLNWDVKRASKARKSNAHRVLEHAIAVALREHGVTVKTAQGLEVRAVDRDSVLAAYKAAYKPDEKVSDGAKRQRFRQALATAGSRIASEIIAGVDYFWFVDEPF
jgi:RecA-family ATPase